MERAEAEAGLGSADINIRLGAARFFGREATPGDKVRLRRARKVETIPWIKRALDRALERANRSAANVDVTPISTDAPRYVLAEIRAQVIDEIAGTVLHELSVPIGGMRMVTPLEMDAGSPYEGSRTQARVETLAKLLAAIRSLKSAVARPTYESVNLAAIAREVCSAAEGYPENFQLAGPKPFQVDLDPRLFSLALGNVVRNAVEALSGLPHGADRRITLNWGQGGQEYWLSVLDTGFGFENDPASMVGFGLSSKEGHIGFGLATAKEAMRVLEGDVYPDNAAQGGACVTLRWLGGNENPIH